MPTAKIFGPVNYGWNGMTTLQNAPDAKGRDFLDTYLQQLASAEKSAHQRLLDVLDIHWYPEARGGNVRVSEHNNSDPVVAARLQAPRSLWDPAYQEDSWITKDVLHEPIRLLPRLQDKIDRNYKDTLLAITEYNYGGGDHISGALAQADVLGIFGRQNLFAAAEFPLARDEPFIAAAFHMFRGFDGQTASFGDISILAATTDIPDTSVYASLDSTNPKRLVLVALNKTAHPLAASIRLANAPHFTHAALYQLAAKQPQPHPADPPPLTDPTHLTLALPAMSVTTLELTAP